MSFRITYKCETCGTTFKKVRKTSDAPAPPCPNLSCESKFFERPDIVAARKVREPKPNIEPTNVAAGEFPSIGGSTIAKAVDATAEIVMQDYKLGDLRDGVRQGETMTPKLAPKLQELADNMFARNRSRNGAMPILGGPQGARVRPNLGARALAGEFSPTATGTQDRDPVAMQHAKRAKPPVHIIASDTQRKP